ncbi:MAG: MMPL family transporter [bacterium]|nr:MMPL family transporter [bacterium]
MSMTSEKTGPASRLVAWAIARPRRMIGVMIALTLAAAPGLSRLELRTDGKALVSPDDPVVLFDAEVREHFHLDDPIVVFLTTDHSDGIYNLETLRTVDQLTQALRGTPGIEADRVMSLATERRDRVYPGTLEFRPFLDPLPDTPERMAQLASDVDAAGILTGTLVTADRRATTILVGIPSDSVKDQEDRVDRAELYRRIQLVTEPFATATDEILVVGAPAAESLLGSHLIEDMTVIVPLCLAVIGLVIGLGCRRIWGPLLGFMEVGACLVWTFGLMGWTGIPVYLTTPVLLVVLTTIGLADEIHIFWHYQRRIEDDPTAPRRQLVRQTMEAMTRPVILTSVTTSIGFVSFVGSPIPPVRSFGLFAALGILFCMLWSLTVVPAFLVLLGPDKLRHPRRTGDWMPWTWRWSIPLLRRRRVTLAALLAVSLVAAFGLSGLHVQDSWIDGFKPTSPFRVATERVNAQLHGTHTLIAHLDFHAEGALASHDVLTAIGELEAFARAQPGVGGVLGTHTHLTAVSYLWQGRKESARTIPESSERVRLLVKRFDDGRGVLRRRQILDDDLRRTVVTIFLKNANYRETAVLMATLERYAQQHLEPLGAKLGFAGDVAVSQAMIPTIVGSQVNSLLLAVVGALVCLCLLYRSAKMALYAILPVAVAVLWVFGAMGWAGMPLGVATSMFCAITLGVGVDYAIHFIERYRRAGAAGLPRPAEIAAREAGPAIATDTVAVALGFGLLVVSQAPSNARLGMLVAMALGAGLLLTLGGLGAALASRSSEEETAPALATAVSLLAGRGGAGDREGSSR